MLFRRFNEFGFSSVFGLQPISRLALLGVESTEGSGVALATSAMWNGSSYGAWLLNCSWKWSFHLWSWSVSSQSGVPSLAVTCGRPSLDAVRPMSVRMVR